jgi:hypothetical protein
VAFPDVANVGANGRGYFSVGAARFRLQLYDIAIDVVAGNRAASREPSRDYHRSKCRGDTQ